MKLHLNKTEMLLRRRMAAGLEPLRTDSTISDLTGVDVDAALLGELRARYLHLLDTAEPDMLAPSDISSRVSLHSGPYGGAAIVLPDDCRRVLWVRMAGWQRAVNVVPDATTAVSAAQSNPCTAATLANPAAAICADGTLCVWPAGGVPLRIMAVVDDGPDMYHVDEKALSQLFESEFNIV